MSGAAIWVLRSGASAPLAPIAYEKDTFMELSAQAHPIVFLAQAHPIVFWTIIAYVFVAGLVFWPVVRRPLMNWYRSGMFFISGKSPVDILLKQVGYRLGFEAFIFALSCVFGALGGWVFVLSRGNESQSVSQ
jgi:hypothetical protein